MSTPETRKFTLKSSDGEAFEVDEGVAVQCQTIKRIIEDDCVDTTTVIPLANVTGNILSKVIEYCKKHATDDEVKAFDEEFVKLDHPTLFDLIMAANYLDIKSLLDLTCLKVADMIKDYSPEEVRKVFNIENDFTPEEEAAIRNEHSWAFE
ncbi:hypothetical protein Leryth_023896 [Lithospermum erythrorhizon]|nr:hypothetical protein Leryth_023896 [Lithospermum erythrorhizon]